MYPPTTTLKGYAHGGEARCERDITGLDVKLEQYRLGERFADAVARRQGMEGLNRVWERPENLPSLAEVRDPGLWMTRMEGS